MSFKTKTDERIKFYIFQLGKKKALVIFGKTKNMRKSKRVEIIGKRVGKLWKVRHITSKVVPNYVPDNRKEQWIPLRMCLVSVPTFGLTTSMASLVHILVG